MLTLRKSFCGTITQIECSNCGAQQRFKYSEKEVNSLIAFGWFSYGNKLYCPECMANPVKHFEAYLEWLDIFGEATYTKDVIMEIVERQGTI